MRTKGLLTAFAAMILADALLFGACFAIDSVNNISSGIKAYELTLKPEKADAQEINTLTDCDWHLLNDKTGATVFQTAYAYYNRPYSYYCELHEDNTLEVWYRLTANCVGGGTKDESTIFFFDTSNPVLHKTVTVDKETKRELLQKAKAARCTSGRCPLDKRIVVCDGTYRTLYYKNALYSVNYYKEDEIRHNDHKELWEFGACLDEFLKKNVFE